MDIGRAALTCAVDRAVAMVGLGPVAVRTDPGWVAVRSGCTSNDLNVVVSEPGFVPGVPLLMSLLAWFADLPVSWLVREPDEALTRRLVETGWQPERTGRVCGRALPRPPAGGRVAVIAVVGDDDVEHWLDVAQSCGWCADSRDRQVWRGLLAAYRGDTRRAAWVASWEGRPVAMASGWCDGQVVEIVDVAVVEPARRRGVGTALVAAVLEWGAVGGAGHVVAQPSPDGWRLFETLGFSNVAVEPDVCFYRP